MQDGVLGLRCCGEEKEMRINAWVDADPGYQSRIFDLNRADHDIVKFVLIANGLHLEEVLNSEYWRC